MQWNWNQVGGVPAKQYVCGYCGHRVASKEGYIAPSQGTPLISFIYICPGCTRPTTINYNDTSGDVRSEDDCWFRSAKLEPYKGASS